MKLSVALCTYNGDRFLQKQLDSILNQTKNVDEIVICDDNSSDETIKIINVYQEKNPGLIHLFENKPGLGTIKNFEKAISETTGDLIFLSDQDDIWYSEKVEKSIDFFKQNQKCVLLFSNGDLIDHEDSKLEGTLWNKWGFDEEKKAIWANNTLAFKSLVKGDNKITGATLCFKKSLKEKIFPIELPLDYWHDGWLGTLAAAVNGLFFINESLIKYRVHESQQVGISNEGLDTITLTANKEFITKEEYFIKLRKMFPGLKKHIPYNKEKSILDRIIIKLKRIFKS
jgi:glycosyltransferase involved in cell wall biosynthesis